MAERILIVDDSRALRMLLGHNLRQGGYEVLEAGDGEEALERLGGGETVDLVITDFTMPGMNGIELTRRIRALDRCGELPIVLLTTEDQEDKKKEGRSAGATGWIVKPFDPEQLLSVIREMLT
jgi:two-component system chemotaxis response regulator CheY